jgi:hypothetical protein
MGEVMKVICRLGGERYQVQPDAEGYENANYAVLVNARSTIYKLKIDDCSVYIPLSTNNAMLASRETLNVGLTFYQETTNPRVAPPRNSR